MRTAAWTPMLALLAALSCCGGSPTTPPGRAPLILERTIPLPGVKGRIDHLAIDVAGGRLFVSALGDSAVEVVDLPAGRATARITGQSEPQGVAWLAERHELVVASGDGQVVFYGGERLAPLTRLKLGDAAADVRVDPAGGQPVVGYGAGAVAEIDPISRRVIRSVRTPGHPEGFQLDGSRVYVNVPDAARIVTGDLASGGQLAAWPTPGARWNFPMALDKAHGVLAVVFRLPARLRLLDIASGRLLLNTATCGDADDLFFDPARRRLYVICGSGAIDVQQATGAADYRPLARIATRSGARTGLFSVETGRLYVAARAAGGSEAAILVYRPEP